MVTLVNLTGNVSDLVGGAYSDGYAKVWIETNVAGDVIIDASGNQLRLGDAKATLNGSGAFTFTGLWATNSASNPTSFQYRVFVEYATRRPGGQRKPVRWCSGWFSLTATADLADVAEEQYVPPSWMTTATQTLQTYVDDAQAAELAAEAARDAAIDISNISTSDAVVEALVKNTGGAGPLTSAALSAARAASQTAHVNGFRDMVEKLRNQQQDVNLLIVGDSTADMTTGGAKWTTGLAAAIGALFPTHTVKERAFDYTTTNDWLAATTIQTGTGYRSDLGAPKTLTVWVAGWAGKKWADWLRDSRRPKVFAGDTVNADVTVFALGHNDDITSMSVAPIRDRDLAFVEWVRAINPKSQIVLCSQNPRIGVSPSLSPGHAELRNDIYRTLARQRGYGYINITQAFYDDGRSLVPGAAGGLIEGTTGVHPTQPDGYDLWRDTFVQQIKQAPGAVPLPTSVPAFTQSAPRIIGMNTTPILSNGWTGTNVTEASEASIVRAGHSSSVKLTKTAGLVSRVDRTIPLAQVFGQTITLRGWLYIPSTFTSVTTTWAFIVSGVLAETGLVENVLRDEWFPISLTQYVPFGASSVSVRLWIDNDTSAEAVVIYVDEFDVIPGNLPLRAS